MNATVLATVLAGAGAGLGLGLAWWGGQRLFHRAILRGLRAPRVAHEPPLAARPLSLGRLQATRVRDARGRQLAAWLAWPPGVTPGPVPAVLVMHGWGANASMMWPVLTPMLGAGLAVLLLDARCHGDSDDEPYTSMPRFAEDIATGLHWLGRQAGIDGQRLAVLGHSVGAAAALLHASRAPDPAHSPAVRAIVSLSAFAHPQEVMRRFLAGHHLPYPLLGWSVLRHVQRVIGARFDDIAPLHTIRHVTCPVLLVHGRDDDTVPFDDARRLQRAAPQAELLAVAGGHDLRDTLAPDVPRIVAFLTQALQPVAAAQQAVHTAAARPRPFDAPTDAMSHPSAPAFPDAATTWNRRFEGDEFHFGTEPNAWLKAHAACWRPGARVLCVADGEGRNSVWLAQQGCVVEAFDIAEVGVAKARRLAERQGVSVNFTVAGCDDYAWPVGTLDGVAAIFIQFADPAARERLFAHMVASLKPGGVLVLQGYTPRQLEYRTGGPSLASHLYTPELLRSAFGALEILALSEYEAEVAEGSGHRGRSALIGLVARKR